MKKTGQREWTRRTEEEEEDNDAISPASNDQDKGENRDAIHRSIDLRVESKEEEDHPSWHIDDLIHLYLNELIQHSSTLSFSDQCMDTLSSSGDARWVSLQACLCYVEATIGSSRSDLSEDSIERSLFLSRSLYWSVIVLMQIHLFVSTPSEIQDVGPRLRSSTLLSLSTKYSCPFSSHRLHVLPKEWPLTSSPLSSGDSSRLVLWISSLYSFLSDVPSDALSCFSQLHHLLSETLLIKSSSPKVHFSSFSLHRSSPSHELSDVFFRIIVAGEHDALATLIKILEKKIRLFYTDLSRFHPWHEKVSLPVRNIFNQIFIQIVDTFIQ